MVQLSRKYELAIRRAQVEDLEDIKRIYNYFIRNSIYTMDIEEKTTADMEKWLESHQGRYPAFVGLLNNKIIGVASLSKWADRKGYYPSCEFSIYLAPELVAQGYSQKLLQHVISFAEKNDFKTIITFITATNKVAINAVRRNKFEYIGKMRQVGCKNNQLIDLDLYQYFIG